MLEKWTKHPPGTSGAASTPHPASASNHLTTPTTAPACPGGFRAMGLILSSISRESLPAHAARCMLVSFTAAAGRCRSWHDDFHPADPRASGAPEPCTDRLRLAGAAYLAPLQGLLPRAHRIRP